MSSTAGSGRDELGRPFQCGRKTFLLYKQYRKPQNFLRYLFVLSLQITVEKSSRLQAHSASLCVARKLLYQVNDENTQHEGFQKNYERKMCLVWLA